MFRVMKWLTASLAVLTLISCGGGGGSVTDTVLVYVVGSDLESGSQSATRNIEQMLAVSQTSHLNIVLETGGADSTSGPLGIDWTHVQRYLVSDGKLQLLQDLGPDQQIDMGKGSTLQDFLLWGDENYPASRNILILWDHGGGPNGHFGSDEVTGTSMSLADLTQAVQGAGVYYSMIGFDACTMGSVEIASALAPYASYLVASEDYEPGDGWNYTPWLTALQNEPDASTPAIGRNIVDAYMAQDQFASTTLSVVDLRGMAALNIAMNDFANALQPYVAHSVLAWQILADARMRSLDFASQNFLQPSPTPSDLVDELLWVGNVQSALTKSFGPDSALSAAADEVINATEFAVVYNRATSGDSQATGLSVYAPSILEAYPQQQYASNLLIGGRTVFSPDYVNTYLPSYYDFYVQQQQNLVSTLVTQPLAAGTFDATVTNAFDMVLVAAGNPNCTLYFGDTAQQQPCEETMQQATSYTHNPGDTTWQFQQTLSGTWPMLEGAPVLLIPDPSVLNGASSLGYLIPAERFDSQTQAFVPGYLHVVIGDNAGVTTYTATEFQPRSTPSPRMSALVAGDRIALDDYAQNSDGAWVFVRSSRTITLDSPQPAVSFGAYTLVSGSPLNYLVYDLTGHTTVGQAQTY